MRASSVLVVLAFLLAAGPAAAQARCPAVVLVYDDLENLVEKRVDSNRNCTHDQFVYYVGGRPERTAIDSNHDGVLDTWTFYEKDGQTIARQEFDVDGDGNKDRWVQHREGKPAFQLDDKNMDGEPDSKLYYGDGIPQRLEEDTNLENRKFKLRFVPTGSAGDTEAIPEKAPKVERAGETPAIEGIAFAFAERRENQRTVRTHPTTGQTDVQIEYEASWTGHLVGGFREAFGKTDYALVSLGELDPEIQDRFQEDFVRGSSPSPKTLKAAMEATREFEFQFFGYALLEVSMARRDPATDQYEVTVKLSATITDLRKRFARITANAAPVVYRGLGATRDEAETHARSLALDSVTNKLLQQWKVGEIH